MYEKPSQFPTLVSMLHISVSCFSLLHVWSHINTSIYIFSSSKTKQVVQATFTSIWGFYYYERKEVLSLSLSVLFSRLMKTTEKIIAEKWREKGEIVERGRERQEEQDRLCVPEAKASAGLFINMSQSLPLVNLPFFLVLFKGADPAISFLFYSHHSIT